MRMRVIVPILSIAVGAGGMWWGCGSSGGPFATFQGNVSSVSPPQSMREAPLHRWLAEVDSLVLPKALAQSTCPAKHVIACATNGRDNAVCVRVDSECGFSVSLDVLGGDFSKGSFGFVDDVNSNRAADSGERVAFLFTSLGRVCNGTVVTLKNVAIDFNNGSATAGSVVKDPDTCPPTTPTPTRTPSVGPTRTPTYYAAASLNQPPSKMLAFLSALGVVGLLLPPRRRRPRRRSEES